MYRAYDGPGGISIERMLPDYEAQEGETLFEDWPSVAELQTAFPAAMLAAAIAARADRVDALRDAKFADGMAYGGKVLQLRDVDQQRIIAAGASAKFAVLASAAWQSDFGWIMADNSVLPLTAAEMSAMADAAASQVQAWIFNGHAHKQALAALTELAAVAAYDISTGW